MPFSNTPRVIYQKNPLERVICQLRFPPILIIDAKPPAEFQEEIRADYPQYDETKEGPDIPPEFLEHIPPNFAETIFKSIKKHEFRSADGVWIVTLTNSFLALTCQRYTTWENFKEHLEKPLTALLNCYKPSDFTRIGLRYQNVIRRARLNLSDTEWAELLNSYVAAEFASDIASSIQQAGRNLIVNLEGLPGQVRIQHGLIQNLEDENGGRCYLIDNDFFTEQQMEANDARNILDSFNARSGRLFRWCISKRLHEAMEPTPVE